ncbi:MAG: hypothetical protein IKR04_01590 [Clostridia bacterium]|nr:hypothetical protein [Clostridia bacterium]
MSSYRTLVKSDFNPNATLKDVNDLLQNIIIKNKGKETENDLDKFLKAINRLPRPLYSLAINVLSWLDFHGKLPKYIYKICPFHSSVIITHMGSIGSEPMYHHICNWGTTSLFIAVGAKRKIKQIDNDGNIIEKKIIRLRFVADERIADGYYLSKSLKYFNYLFSNPELLEIPPEKVLEDDQI